MLRSLQNQVSFFGGGQRSLTSPNSLMNQLSENVNRMTQSMMDQMSPRVQTRPPVFADNTLNANVDTMPIDMVFGPPRNLQNTLNVPEPTPKQQQTILVVPVGQKQWGSTLTDTVLPQMTRNGVNILVVERNETSGTNQPTVSKTTTTRITDPTIRGNTTMDAILKRIRASGRVSPFLPSTSDGNGKGTFNGVPQPNANNVVSVPGGTSFIVLDGSPIDAQTLAIADNAVPVMPFTGNLDRIIETQSAPFDMFSNRQNRRAGKRSDQSKTTTWPSKPKTSSTKSSTTKPVTPEVTQSQGVDMGVPVNIDTIQGMTSGFGGVAPTVETSLIYSQDSVSDFPSSFTKFSRRR